jgi:hypothetical protein
MAGWAGRKAQTHDVTLSVHTRQRMPVPYPRTLHAGAAPHHQHHRRRDHDHDRTHHSSDDGGQSAREGDVLPFADLLAGCFSAFPGDAGGVPLLLHLLALPGQQLGALR